MKIFHGDLFAKEIVALFRAVAAKRFDASHFVHSFVEGADAGLRQRACDVAYSQLDDFSVRMGGLERRYSFGDF